LTLLVAYDSTRGAIALAFVRVIDLPHPAARRCGHSETRLSVYSPEWIGAVLTPATGWLLAVLRVPNGPDPSSADGLAAGQVSGAGELGEVGGREGGIEVPERGEHVLDPVDPDAPASVQQVDEPAHRHLEPTEGP
jgi:hypothetical protein